MSEQLLQGRHRRRWKRTTVADPETKIAAEDLIGRQFQPAELDVCWAGDITYVWTWEGWLYLATVIDLGSRRVVGWAMADHMRADLVCDALRMAIEQRRPRAGLSSSRLRGLILRLPLRRQDVRSQACAACPRVGAIVRVERELGEEQPDGGRAPALLLTIPQRLPHHRLHQAVHPEAVGAPIRERVPPQRGDGSVELTYMSDVRARTDSRRQPAVIITCHLRHFRSSSACSCMYRRLVTSRAVWYSTNAVG